MATSVGAAAFRSAFDPAPLINGLKQAREEFQKFLAGSTQLKAAFEAAGKAATAYGTQVAAGLRSFLELRQHAKEVDAQLLKLGTSLKSTAAQAGTMSGAVGLLGNLLSSQVLSGLGDVANFLADRLSPDLSAVTGSIEQQTKALRDLDETARQFAIAFEEGQRRAVDPLVGAFARLQTALIPTNTGFARLLGTMGEFSAIALRVTGSLASLGATVVILQQGLEIMKKAFEIKVVQDFFEKVNFGQKSISGLSDVIKLVAAVVRTGLKTALTEIIALLSSLPGVIASAGTAFTRLAASLGLGPLGLAFIVGTTLVGAFLALKTAFADTSNEALRYGTAIERITARNKQLGDSIRQSVDQLKNQLTQLKLTSVTALAGPGAADLQVEIEKRQQILATQQAISTLREQILQNVAPEERKELEAILDALDRALRLETERVAEIRKIQNAYGETTTAIAANHRAAEAARTEEVARLKAQQTALAEAEQRLTERAARGENVERSKNALLEKQREITASLAVLSKQAADDQVRFAQQGHQALLDQRDALAKLQQERASLGDFDLQLTARIKALEQEREESVRRRVALEAEAKQRNENTRGSPLERQLAQAGIGVSTAGQIEVERQKQSALEQQIKSLQTIKQFTGDEVSLNEKLKALQLEVDRQIKESTTSLRQMTAAQREAQTAAESAVVAEKDHTATIVERQHALDMELGYLRAAASLAQQRGQATVQQLESDKQRLEYARQEAESLGERTRAEHLSLQIVEKDRQILEARQGLIRQAAGAQEAVIAKARELQGTLTANSEEWRRQEEQIQGEVVILDGLKQQARQYGVALEGAAQQGALLARQFDRSKIQESIERLQTLNAIAQARGKQDLQQLEQDKQRLEYQRQYIEADEQTFTNQNKLLQLAVRINEKDKEILRTRKELVEADLRALEGRIAKEREYQATFTKGSEEWRKQEDLINADIAAVGALTKEAQNYGVALEGAANQGAILQRSIERINSIQVNFGDIFRQAMNDAYSAVVLGMRRMKDVFEGFKYGVIQQFSDMFAQALQKKLDFDTVFVKNFLTDLPGAVAAGVQKSQGFLSALFSGNFTGGGGVLPALASLGSAGLSGLGSLFQGPLGSVAGGFLGGQIGGVPGMITGAVLPRFLAGGFFGGGSAGGGLFGGVPPGFVGPLQPGFFQQGSGLFGGSGFGATAGVAGLSAAFFGNGSPLARGFSGGLGAAALIPGPQQPFVAAAAILASLFGGDVFGLNKPGRIFLERKGIEEFQQKALGIDIPIQDTQKYLAGAEKSFPEIRDPLSALGAIYARGREGPAVGTIKRFANLALAGFEKEGFDTEEAQQAVAQLAQEMGFTLKNAIRELNEAFNAGELSIKRYKEEVKDGEDNIVKLGDILKGAFDILTEFSDEVDTAKVANNLLAKEFEQTATAAGDWNEQVKALADQVRAGTLPIEDAIIKLNEYRAANGKAALELKDFELDVKDIRQEFLRMGIAIDDVGQQALGIVNALQQVDDQIKALTESIKAIDDAIAQLNLQKLANAFSVTQALLTAQGKPALDILAAERQDLIFPGLTQTLGTPIRSIGDLKTATVGELHPIGTRATPATVDLKDLSDVKLNTLSGLVDQLAQNYINEFNAKLQIEAANIQTALQTKITDLQTAAQAAADAIRKNTQLQAEAIQKAAQERLKALQQEAEKIQKAASLRLEALQKELQAAQAFKQLGDALKQQVIALLGSPASPQSAGEQFSFLQRQRAQLEAKIQGASGTARAELEAELQGVLQQMLQNNPFARTSQDYKDLFEGIVRKLETMRDDALERAKEIDRLEAEGRRIQEEMDASLKRIAEQQQAVSEKASEDLKRLQEAEAVALKAVQDQLSKDIQTAQQSAEKELAAVRQKLADELRPQLEQLRLIKDQIIDEQIRRLEEQKQTLKDQLTELGNIRMKLEEKFAELIDIERDKVAVFLQEIRDALKNKGLTAAAEGYRGIVTQPSLFVAGEKGPEFVYVEPLRPRPPLPIEPLQPRHTGRRGEGDLIVQFSMGDVSTSVALSAPAGLTLNPQTLADNISDLTLRKVEDSVRGGRLRAIIKEQTHQGHGF